MWFSRNIDFPRTGLGIALSLGLFLLWATCVRAGEAVTTNQVASGFRSPWPTLSAGFLAHEFPLTLSLGTRREIAGPLLFLQREPDRPQWGYSPLLSYTQDRGTDSAEFDFAYPLVTYDRFGKEHQFQILQWFNIAGGQNQQEQNTHRFTLFPFYFQQRSDDPAKNYTAVWPFYGHLEHRLFRDDIRFVMWPLYVQSHKRDVVTDNYLLPFFHLRHGDNLTGWQFWPLVGNETKTPGWKLDRFGENELVPGHLKFFLLWPFFFNERLDMGTTNEVRQHVLLPFYSLLRSPLRDSSTYMWPLFTYTEDREHEYREWGAPWPLIGFARGKGKTMNRVWPLFSDAHNDSMKSTFYLWPIYKYNRVQAAPLDRERTRILLFLYSDLSEKNMTTGKAFRRKDFWPFYTFRHDLQDNERLQVLSILEPILPSNKSIERNYSSLWSLWRAEKNAKTGATSQSFLWNLYRADHRPDGKKVSLLFGLFQYQSTAAGRQWRLCYIPVAHSKSEPSK